MILATKWRHFVFLSKYRNNMLDFGRIEGFYYYRTRGSYFNSMQILRGIVKRNQDVHLENDTWFQLFCCVFYVLANNTRVVPLSRVWSPWRPYTILQPFIKIGKSSNLFMHDCPIPMCASCADTNIAWGASFGKRIGRKCAPRALQLKTRYITKTMEYNLAPPQPCICCRIFTQCVLNKLNQ